MASGNDMQAATRTYEGFTTMLKWTVPVLFVLALFVVFLIS